MVTTTLMIAALLVSAPNQRKPACKQAAPGLERQARITCIAARKTALHELGDKGLRVVSAELEEEGGRVVYSFDIVRRGHRGVEEIQVDARTGVVVSRKHESAKDEAKERAKTE
jgi:uncharacterized membrane protein YkoI